MVVVVLVLALPAWKAIEHEGRRRARLGEDEDEHEHDNEHDLGSNGKIQHFPQLMGERGRRERLLQMCGALLEYAVMDDGSLGIRGSEKDSGVRIGCAHPFRQFFATHMRHNEIDHCKKLELSTIGNKNSILWMNTIYSNIIT